MSNASVIAASRLYWQLGRWEDLAAIEVPISTADAMSDEDVELALYKSHALFQIGEIDEGSALVRSLAAVGISRSLILESLWSGAQSTLARIAMLSGNRKAARSAIAAAAERSGGCGDGEAIAEMRARNEWSRVKTPSGEEFEHSAAQRKLFIDCGGFDGCSALKFLLSFPEFDVVTFEPNPAMWRYFTDIPTQLIKKAAYTYDGSVSFRIDAIDGTGSSLVESKKVDNRGIMTNEESPLILAPCIDLSAFVERMATQYDKIVLKLDVEGAEYDILEKMLEDETLSLVDQLYCEFHHEKMDIELSRHRDILARARAVTHVEPWDSHYSVFKLAPADTEEQLQIRKRIIKDIKRVRRNTLKLRW